MTGVLGIAVVTYNRFDRLRQVVGRLLEFTESPYRLVIAEDGGGDRSRDWATGLGLHVLSGQNHGVCWNKNRGLFALMEQGCDPVLLFEDDIYPVERGWEKHWIEAAALWGHVSYAHPKIQALVSFGSGTAADPYVNQKATAQCTAISAAALAEVGFLDTRFKGYGVGHAEWTSRIKRTGVGYKVITTAIGAKAKANLYIGGGLKEEDAVSFRNNASVEANKAVYKEIKREPVFRLPWRGADERREFLAEQVAAGYRPEALAERLEREAERVAGLAVVDD